MKLLYIQPGYGVGGSKISLMDMLRGAPADQSSFVVLQKPCNTEYHNQILQFAEKIFYLDLPTWQKYHRRTFAEKARAPISDLIRLLNLLSAILRVVRIVQDCQIDIVHTNNGLCPAGAFAAYFTRRPHIWHIRERIGSKGDFPLILGDRSLRIFSSLSNTIICNSVYTKKTFTNANIPAIVIQNGIDLDGFENSDERGRILRQKLIGDFNGIVLGMSGNLTTKMKKHELFLQIASAIKARNIKCKFIVFGGQTDLDISPYTKRLKDLSKALNIEEDVVWADFIADIPAIMGSIDILVHPASREGSGRIVMEAMAAGKPVICVKSGGVQELVQDRITGFLVSPDTVNEFLEAVLELIHDVNLRQRIGTRCKEFATENFSYKLMAQKVQDVYHSIQV